MHLIVKADLLLIVDYTMIKLRSSFEPLLCRLPIDHIPDGLKVLRLPVLILQVITMFPGIDAKEWSELSHDGILVGVCPDDHLPGLCVLDEPCPSRALDASEGGIELLLQGVNTAVGFINGLGESTGRRLAATGALRGEVLPEEGVVCVAAAVEVDGGLEGDLSGDVGCLDCLLHLLDGIVVVRDVGLVVHVVMELHYFA